MKLIIRKLLLLNKMEIKLFKKSVKNNIKILIINVFKFNVLLDVRYVNKQIYVKNAIMILI